MKKSVLRSYAKLIARKGVNIEKGQEVFIQCQTEQIEFTRMLVDECYKAGASKVIVDFYDLDITVKDYKYASKEALGKLNIYQTARWKHYVKTIPCRIYLESEDPEGLKSVDQLKMAQVQQMRYKTIKKYRDQLEGKYQWCIAGVPSVKWAKKVFPGLRASEAVEKLWQAILQTSRVIEPSLEFACGYKALDPCEEWDKHNADLEKRCSYLNSLGITSLHYSASNGTDLTVGMIPEAGFMGGGEMSLTNHFFNPNIPSEECFISPMRGKAEGIVYSSMPLSYQSQIIDEFWIKFKDGKAVEWDAKKNPELLTKMLTMDEGAAYLGECALVPYDSPISNSGILFLSTLYDENASCHLAMGMGYVDTIIGYDKYTLEEMRKMGINDSMIHVDFMIGTKDLNIDAVLKDGSTAPIFREGNWAF